MSEVRWGIPQSPRVPPRSRTFVRLGQASVLSHTVDAVIWQPPLQPLRGKNQDRFPQPVPRSTIKLAPRATVQNGASHWVDAVIVAGFNYFPTPLEGKPQATRTAPRPVVFLQLAQTASLSHTVDAVISGASVLPFLPYEGLRQTVREVPRSEISVPLPLTFTLSHSVDAVVLKTFTLTHQVDAVVSQAQTILGFIPLEGKSQQLRVVPRPDISVPLPLTFTLSHQVDAVILKTATLNHTVDAVLIYAYPLLPYRGVGQAVRGVARPETTTPLPFPVALSHAVDAVIWQERLLPAEGIKQTPRDVARSRVVTPPTSVVTTTTLNHAVDAVIVSPYPPLPYVGARQTLRPVPRPEVLIPLPTTLTLSHQVDAVVLKTFTLIYQVDAVVLKSFTLTHQVDAVIWAPPLQPYRGVTQSPRLVGRPEVSAVLPSSQTVSHTVDAVIVNVLPFQPYRGVTQSPRLVARSTTFFQLGQTVSLSHTVDAVIAGFDYTFVHPLVGRIPTPTVPARLGSRLNLGFAFGVVPQAVITSHTVDAVIYAYPALPYRGVAQALRPVARPKVSVPLPATRTLSHTVTAVIKTVFTLSHQVDGVVRKTFTLSHTVDAVVLKTFTLTHTVTAVIFKTVPLSHTVTAVVFKTIATSHAVDAVILRAGNVRSHTVTAEIGQPYKLVSHTVTAYVFDAHPTWPQSDDTEWPQDTDPDEWPQGTDPDDWPQGGGGGWPQSSDNSW